MAITRDYGRMLLMLRQRIVIEDPVAYETAPDFSKYGTKEYFELTRQKHKYSLVRTMHDLMLKSMKSFADKAGYTKLGADCQEAQDRFSKERIPLPKAIPEYIESWRQKVQPEDLAARMTLEEMFDQPE
jgi:hypothetical protein